MELHVTSTFTYMCVSASLRSSKKMSSFSVQGFQEKLNRLTSSQDSIETLSLWVIHHKAHGKTSTAVWLDNVEKGN